MPGKWPTRTICSLVVAASCLLGAVGCGEEDPGYGSKPPDYEEALAGAPKPLAALYADGNEVLGGGVGAFRSRIESLRGYPVVVNKWASWCGPCRFEFPFYQRLSARLGTRVAFVGVDSDDSDAAARTFLREFPIPFPSYSDPDEDIAVEIKATLGFPSTAFYDTKGELVYTHQGVYADQGELLADIRRYALSG
jgi:cytochrome c biogenesis protein CcmG/thiol:disulfide interchange protein DsbE